LLIGIATEAERAEKLAAWLALPKHVYAGLEDGTKVRASFDPRQIGEQRLSSVQYLKFPVGSTAPVAMGCDLPALTVESELSPAQRAALQEDLAT
jgi:hypothetical protein